MEETYVTEGHAFTIGKNNPLIGKRVRVTWLKTWQKKPIGHSVTGVLEETYTPNGRAMIGKVRGRASDEPATMRERPHSCPWSRRYITIEPLN